MLTTCLFLNKMEARCIEEFWHSPAVSEGNITKILCLDHNYWLYANRHGAGVDETGIIGLECN